MTDFRMLAIVSFRGGTGKRSRAREERKHCKFDLADFMEIAVQVRRDLGCCRVGRGPSFYPHRSIGNRREGQAHRGRGDCRRRCPSALKWCFDAKISLKVGTYFPVLHLLYCLLPYFPYAKDLCIRTFCPEGSSTICVWLGKTFKSSVTYVTVTRELSEVLHRFQT